MRVDEARSSNRTAKESDENPLSFVGALIILRVEAAAIYCLSVLSYELLE